VVLRAAILILVGLVVVGMVLWALQRRLIYLPDGAPAAAAAVLPGADEVTFRTDDGLDLDAWFLAAGPTGAVARAGVLVLPGNGGNRAGRATTAQALADRGLSVLLVDYRGYGGNPGAPSEDGLRADARAAYDWLAGQVDEVVVFGESLGSAVAVGLATERPAAAVILRSPFPSLVAVAREHYGPVPRWLLRDRYPVVDQLADVDAPILVVLGDADTIVPPDLSREVAAVAGAQVIEIAGADHNDPALFDGRELIDAVTDFVGAHTG
jgi:uncharacterized protein